VDILGINRAGKVTVQKIPDTIYDSLQKRIATQEIWSAAQQGACLKSSGVEGISHDFYVTLWETIKNDLKNMYNLKFQTRKLTDPHPLANIGNNSVHT
jgi:hypothetical protein